MLNSHPLADEASAVRITIGVCTCQRPQMLTECLVSLSQLMPPFGVAASIVIVDNEASESTRELVEAFAAKSSLPMQHIAEPRRGIAFARNAIIEAALDRQADWIVMLDDDQVVPPDWLQQMKIAQARGNADVVKSSVMYRHPEPLPRWSFPRVKPFEGRLNVKTTQTNGVMFRAALVRAATRDGRHRGLRFDERFNLSSGEDRDFFARAYQAGAYMIKTPLAVATEFVPASKCSFSAQLARDYFQEITNTVQDRRFYGFAYVMLTKSLTVSGLVLGGLLHFSFAPIVMLGNRAYGRRKLLKGGKRLARAAGICTGLLGLARPQPYLRIHGS